MADQCFTCGRVIEPWDRDYVYRNYRCMDCYRVYGDVYAQKSALCTKCDRRLAPEEANLKLGRTLCEDCYKKELERMRKEECAVCGKHFSATEQKFERKDGAFLCLACFRKQSPFGPKGPHFCARCGRSAMAVYVGEGGEILCMECAERMHTKIGLLRTLDKMISSMRRRR